MVYYRKPKDVYFAYRKSGVSVKFFEEHSEEITLHKAAKDVFEQLKAEKLSTMRELNEEYSRVLTQKKADHVEYRKEKREMQDVVTVKKNIEVF